MSPPGAPLGMRLEGVAHEFLDFFRVKVVEGDEAVLFCLDDESFFLAGACFDSAVETRSSS